MTFRIFLCDDEIHILKAAEFKFLRAGFEVDTAYDGAEALAKIQQSPPDLLITDCQMPRMDGLELVRRLRENPAMRDLPVMLLTAKGLELSASELREKHNIAALLRKPFSPRDLLARAESILRSEPVA